LILGVNFFFFMCVQSVKFFFRDKLSTFTNTAQLCVRVIKIPFFTYFYFFILSPILAHDFCLSHSSTPSNSISLTLSLSSSISLSRPQSLSHTHILSLTCTHSHLLSIVQYLNHQISFIHIHVPRNY